MGDIKTNNCGRCVFNNASTCRLTSHQVPPNGYCHNYSASTNLEQCGICGQNEIAKLMIVDVGFNTPLIYCPRCEQQGFQDYSCAICKKFKPDCEFHKNPKYLKGLNPITLQQAMDPEHMKTTCADCPCLQTINGQMICFRDIFQREQCPNFERHGPDFKSRFS